MNQPIQPESRAPANGSSKMSVAKTMSSASEGHETLMSNDRCIPSQLNRNAPPAPDSLELNIDQLVLEGFPSHDRHRVARAIEDELVRLFTDNGVSDSFATTSWFQNLSLVDARLSANERPEAIGTRVAQLLYREMGK